jgi:hypothetical protein
MITAAEITRQRALLTAHALQDREPAPPPFATGTRVRYVGPDVPAEDGGTAGPHARRDALVHGAEYTVRHCWHGRRGDLTHLLDDFGEKLCWNDDESIPMLDTTTDAHSALSGTYGHLLTAADAHEWEVVAAPAPATV